MTAPAKAAPMREDVTQAQDARRGALVERLGTFSDSLCQVPLQGVLGDVAYDLLRQAAAQIASDRQHIARLAHTARHDAGDELAEIKASMAYRTSLIGRETARADAAEAKLSAPESDQRPDAGDEDVERVARRDPMARGASALAAAISLLEKGGKKAAPSDKMFDQMLIDYRAALAAMREGVDRGMVEREALENAINRMGWDEIHAFQNELRKGQDIYEDAGGFFMRAIKALFGIKPTDTVTAYQDAARALVTAALSPETPR